MPFATDKAVEIDKAASELAEREKERVPITHSRKGRSAMREAMVEAWESIADSAKAVAKGVSNTFYVIESVFEILRF